MAEDVMLQEAISAIRQGQRIRARDLLTRLLRADQSNPEYWLWMSAVTDTQREQVYCLQSVLRLDPDNQAAKDGLILLGALSPGSTVQPVAPVQRKWDVEVQEVRELAGLRAIWANPVVRIVVLSVISLLVVGLIGAGIYWRGRARKRLRSSQPGQPVHRRLTPTPQLRSTKRLRLQRRPPLSPGHRRSRRGCNSPILLHLCM